jgi:hypothetical protein
MNKKSTMAVLLGALMSAAIVAPAPAMPYPTPSAPVEATTDVQQARVIVKYKSWRGHRGYRYARRGYRRHSDGFWYPLAAFGPTIVIRPARRWHWCGPRGYRHRCYR